MKRNALALLIGLVLITMLSACAAQAPVAAAAAPPVYEPPHQMNAQGTGVVYLTPDVAYVTLGVETRADDVSTALNDNNAQATAISNTLKELGVEEKDIQTSAFSVYPQQEYAPDGQSLGIKYVVTNTVYVTVRDLGKMGQLLDAVVRSGANSIYGVQFDAENKDAAFSEARKQAIDNAKKNATELAAAAEIELGDLISVNVWQVSGPSPVYSGKGGAAAPMDGAAPVSAGQMTITMNADLSYEIK